MNFIPTEKGREDAAFGFVLRLQPSAPTHHDPGNFTLAADRA
jgi:hypothetical protein